METKNENYWARHIEGWKASGKSQREYCERSGIALSTFGRWWKKLGQRQKGMECRAPVEIPRPVREEYAFRAGGTGLVVRLPGGIEVHVDERTDEDLLLRVVRTLGPVR
jgi:hypothetical protein